MGWDRRTTVRPAKSEHVARTKRPAWPLTCDYSCSTIGDHKRSHKESPSAGSRHLGR